MSDVRGLIDLVYRAENGGKIDYNVIYGGISKADRPSKPVTQMTVGEVRAWQARVNPKYNSEAVGALQIIPKTLDGMIKKGVVSPNDRFDAATQDRITVALMRGRGLDDWQAGKLTTVDFGTNLAKEWASLPVLKATYRNGKAVARGSAYYGGVGANTSRAHISAANLEAALGAPGRVVVDPSQFGHTGVAGTVYDHGVHQGMSERMGQQYENQPYDFGTGPGWDTPDVTLNGDLEGVGLAGRIGQPGGIDQRVLPGSDYTTRTGEGGGPILQDWGTAFNDAWSDSFFVRAVQGRSLANQYEWQDGFDVLGQMQQDGLSGHASYFSTARSRPHYEAMKTRFQGEQLRQQRMGLWDGSMAHTLGGLLNPDSLVTMALPIGGAAASALRGAGSSFLRSGAKTAFYTGVSETAIEAGRASMDPFSTQLDSIARVGGATILSGLLGGGVGVMAGARLRRELADDLARDIAMAKGVGKATSEVDLGGGVKGRVIFDEQGGALLAEVTGETAPKSVRWVTNGRGVRVVGDAVMVDEGVIQARFKSGQHGTAAQSPNELLEYEVARAGSVARRIKAFVRDESGTLHMDGKGKPDGNPFASMGENGVVVNVDAIRAAMAKGEPITLGPAKGSPLEGKIKPVHVRADAFASPEEAAEAVQKAHDWAAHARDSNEFRENLTTIFKRDVGDMEPDLTRAQRAEAERMAEVDAAEALETFRAENNKILQNAKLEALARLPDSPYKRIHRNALSTESRDLVDLLAADGTFLRGSDLSGLTVGPSVYSRAKTWGGVVRGLYDHETALFEKYLGFESNPSLGDISFRKAAAQKRANGEASIGVDAFRRRVSQTYITGVKDDIPEVMEMAEHLRGAWNAYHGVAEEYGVLTTMDSLRGQMTNLQSRLDNLGEGDSRVEALAFRLDEMRRRSKIAEQEPDEDYFTRIYNKRAIEQNRDVFREQVVKPWMRQQPRIQMWVRGKDELGEALHNMTSRGADEADIAAMKARYDAAPDKSSYDWAEFSTDPDKINERAEKMIDEILGEAEPDDLTTLREAHRPVFGRHRQLNIPNAMLLKAGPKGNAVADFIETDYMLVQNIYSERMGPAIEMARSFARPLDGISAKDGFEEAMSAARVAERRAWDKAGKTGGFADHWGRVERDMLHLRDRVTNRVIRRPDRWDNRVATNLRNWAQLAFMGMAAIPAINEIGTIIMRHGMSRTFQQAFGELDEGMALASRMGVEEMRKAGAIMEVVQGAALSRFAETGMDAINGTAPERWLKTAANKYFLWNGLAPLSSRLKEIDAGLRVHDTLDRIMRVNDLGNAAASDDLAELARWGLSRADAQAIARQPIEELPGGAWIANTDAWGDEALTRRFQAAIAQGNENTILMATAADKPIIMDGTLYLKAGGMVDGYAKKAGLEKKGQYWQVQSGLMTLPFMFWNYAIAAHNKILLAGLDEPSAQKLGGLAAMVGLGYMTASVRASDWDRRDAMEKLTLGIEESGATGILAQMVDVWDQPSAGASLRRAAGAGPAVASNALGGVTSGDLDKASWALPFRNHFLLRDFFDATVDALERNSEG